MNKSACTKCIDGRNHPWHDSGHFNLAYAYEGTLPPSQSSAHEAQGEMESVDDIKRRAFQAGCNVAGCSGDHDFEHDLDNRVDERPQVLMQQAEQLVYGDRQSSYGHPYDDYSRTAGMWSSFLGIEITPAQAALMMVLLKISRERNRPKDDNIVDAHGYLLCYGRIQGREDSD